jgi:oligopeptide transport system permease protein
MSNSTRPQDSPSWSKDRIAAPPESLTPLARARQRFWRNRPAVISAAWLLFVALVLWLGPAFYPYGPETLSDYSYQPPGAQHWLGTDVHGRDLLARILVGTRISLLVGLMGASVSLVIGVTWGAVSAYLGGRWDGLMMRTVDVLYSLPSVVFVIVLITTLEQFFRLWLGRVIAPSWESSARLIFLFVGLGAVSWLTMARIVRGQVLSLKQSGFVEASRAMGASTIHILWRHILPNTSGIIIVYLALTVPAVVLSESFLSYLGLGIQPPQASLGSLIADGAGQINPIRIYWWLIVSPAGFLASLLLALNFVGDGLRDAWDPRTST